MMHWYWFGEEELDRIQHGEAGAEDRDEGEWRGNGGGGVGVVEGCGVRTAGDGCEFGGEGGAAED